MTATRSQRSSKRRKLSPSEDDSVTHPSQKRKSLRDPNAQTAEKAQKDPPSDMPPDPNVQTLSVKGLDSSEPAIRRSAMNTILEQLQSRPTSVPLSSTECLQLWRGFFVAVYMHDSRNALSVQTFLRQIARSFDIFSANDDKVEAEQSPDNESIRGSEGWLDPYHIAFWETVQREWAQIDSHRMNKYLLLIRFVMRELFAICLHPVFKQNIQTGSAVTQRKLSRQSAVKDKMSSDNLAIAHSARRSIKCAEIFGTVGPLNPSLRKMPDGLRLHILDVWNDELFGELSDLEKIPIADSAEAGESRVGELTAIFHTLQHPLQRMSESDSGAQKHVRMRAKETVKEMNEKIEERSGEKTDS